MKKLAYLTIDDGPSEKTPELVECLAAKGAKAVMFFTGERLERFPSEALLAAKAGIVVGNHSTSHPSFSKLRFDQAVNEIALMEDRIEELYAKAGLPRPAKVFRFPYGDKGGANRQAIQDFLAESGFQRLRAPGLRRPDFEGNRLDAALDLTWSYDSRDYLFMQEASGWTKESYVARLDELTFRAKPGFWAAPSEELILMHDLPKVNEALPGYFSFFLGELEKRGVAFKAPAFR